MNNITALTKIYLKQLVARFASLFNKRKQSAIVATLVIIAAVLLLGFSVSTMVFGYASMLNQAGLHKYIISFGLLISGFLSMLLVMFEVPEHFYKNKDYESLASLPIKSWEVVTAKTLSAYISTLIYSTVLMLPVFVVHFIFNKVTVLGVIFSFISIFLVPMFVVFIGCIFGYVVYIITSRLKNKTALNTVASVLFIFLIFGVSFLSQTFDITIIFKNDTPLLFKILVPYIYFLSNAVVLQSWLCFLYFVLISATYLAVAIFVISKSYKKINSNMLTTKTKVSKKPLSYKQSSPFKSLLKKEAKSFFGCTIWTINVIIGPVMIMIAAVTLGIFTAKLAPAEPELLPILSMILLLVIPALSGTCVTTNISVSMEGRRIEVLKQLPITFFKMTFSKILFSWLIIYIPIFLAVSIYVIITPFNWLFTLALFVIPAISTLAFSVMGLLINFAMPKMIWKKDVEVVKQSASLMVSMFSNMLFSAVPFVLFFTFLDWAIAGSNMLWCVSFALIWYTLYLALSLILLKYKGKKLYSKIY